MRTVRKFNVKKWLNVLFFLLVFGLTIWSVFRGEDLGMIFDSIGDANPAYLIPAVACVVLFILGESVILHRLFRKMGQRVKMKRCCLYSFIGFFYSAVTPSASGGQPMQVIEMRRDGISAAVSTVVLAVVTILYKLVLVVIGLAILLLGPDKSMHSLDSVMPRVWLAVGLNVTCVALLLLLVFHPGVIRLLLRGALNVGMRLHIIHNREKWEHKTERSIEQYQSSAEFFRQHPVIVLDMFVVTLIQRTVLFFVTYLVYKALGLSGETAVVITMMQAMIAVTVDMLPTPGGMGISENLFLTVFLPVFGEAMVTPGMVLSRGIAYYTQLLLSGCVTAFGAIRKRNRES